MTRKFNTVKKDRLFYDKFEYNIGFRLDEASCLRFLDHGMIDDLIERRKQWREIAQQRWINGKLNHSLILRRRWRAITEKTVEDLHTVADVLMHNKSEFKTVVSVDTVHVYTNDLNLIDLIDQLDCLTHKSYSQARVIGDKNTVRLKNPKNQFRTYLKYCKLSPQQKDHLMNFLCNQRSHVRISPALQRWLDQPFDRVQDYFFVDHDSHTWLTMLSLVCPNIIRKTMHIIPAK
jgi:hypothetical protein